MPLVPHAKIAPPGVPPEFVARPALRSALDEVRDVALVCAPAGHGKTLLLADWARTSRAVDTAWVSLDRDDDDPRRLWSAVVAALATCPSVPPSSRLRRPWAWPAGGQPEFLAELVESLLGLAAPVRLVLDDLHELTDPETLRGIETFLRNRPPMVRLVLCGRFDPPLGLPRLRLTGRLRELRADRLRFSVAETALLLEKSGLQLRPEQVEVLARRTGGWVAGLRLAALALAEAPDVDDFLAHFSGDERSVADYLVGEVLSRLPEEVQEFLRVTSVSDPVPAALAGELSGRDDAGSMLDALDHQTSLFTATGHERDTYRQQPLLRSYLLADLQRQGPRQAARLHATAARWWADRDRPVEALDHAGCSDDPALLSALLHRFAVCLVLTGEHRPLQRALATLGAHATAVDPWLAVTSAIAHLEAGELTAAQVDMRHADRHWPAHDRSDLTILRIVAEQLGAAPPGESFRCPVGDQLDEVPVEPELEALVRLARGTAQMFDRGDEAAARVELEGALELARRYDFAYLAMQAQTLLGVAAATTGNLPAMRAASEDAVALAAAHGWDDSAWVAGASAMLAYAALLRAEPDEAVRLATRSLGPAPWASAPPLRFVLRAVHGAAVFDGGDRARGLAEMQQARSEFADRPAGPQQVATAAMLEFRAALLLGHPAAARTVQGWLAERVGDCAELLIMRAWTEAALGRHDHARGILRGVLDRTSAALLTQSMVEAWLLETSLAAAAGERPAARRALETALALAEPLDLVRPFTQAGGDVRELLVHQHGSFGAAEEFAARVLAAGGPNHREPAAMLSERELTVLALLPSLLSLDEIATDLTVSVNTVKSHVRSIYTKLGVSSRRTAVLTAHEQGLLAGVRTA